MSFEANQITPNHRAVYGLEVLLDVLEANGGTMPLAEITQDARIRKEVGRSGLRQALNDGLGDRQSITMHGSELVVSANELS